MVWGIEHVTFWADTIPFIFICFESYLCMHIGVFLMYVDGWIHPQVHILSTYKRGHTWACTFWVDIMWGTEHVTCSCSTIPFIFICSESFLCVHAYRCVPDVDGWKYDGLRTWSGVLNTWHVAAGTIPFIFKCSEFHVCMNIGVFLKWMVGSSDVTSLLGIFTGFIACCS